jgi:hypothetical protein
MNSMADIKALDERRIADTMETLSDGSRGVFAKSLSTAHAASFGVSTIVARHVSNALREYLRQNTDLSDDEVDKAVSQ